MFDDDWMKQEYSGELLGYSADSSFVRPMRDRKGRRIAPAIFGPLEAYIEYYYTYIPAAGNEIIFKSKFGLVGIVQGVGDIYEMQKAGKIPAGPLRLWDDNPPTAHLIFLVSLDPDEESGIFQTK